MSEKSRWIKNSFGYCWSSSLSFITMEFCCIICGFTFVVKINECVYEEFPIRISPIC
ncbi:unnamed protein product [Brassica rapa subsp. trilocularis]